MKTRWILLAVMALAGCSSPGLKLTDGDGRRNLRAVQAYVPVGTDETTAVELMTKAGFTCQVVKDGVVVDVKPKTGASDVVGKTVSVIVCDKSSKSAGGYNYQVHFELDDQYRVASQVLSSGLSKKGRSLE